MQHLGKTTWVVGVAVTLITSSGAPGLTVEEKCNIAKAKATAVYYKCLTKAQIKGIKKGLPEDQVNQLAALCEAKHAIKFLKAEGRAIAKGALCGSIDDAAEVQALVLPTLYLTVAQDEELGTCETGVCAAGIPRTGQTTLYTAGDDGDIQAGVAWPNPRFTNNGDGTVTDNLTGLRIIEDWDCDALHGGSGVAWTTALTNVSDLADGTCGLTDGSVAGDWRLANRNELLSLIDLEFFPAVPNTAGTGQITDGDPFKNVFNTTYWSSTTYLLNTSDAWTVGVGDGAVNPESKNAFKRVLAVSGGDL